MLGINWVGEKGGSPHHFCVALGYGRGISGGMKDHGNVAGLRVGLETHAYLEPIQIGEVDIQQNRIWLVLQHQSERFSAGAGIENAIAGRAPAFLPMCRGELRRRRPEP